MSQKSVVNILCPIETINRELDFRLFFAAYCVRPGLRFVVGKQFSISDLIDEVHGGLYFGQNLAPIVRARPKASLVKSLQTMRDHRITLVHLDEEGGVMAGDEERWKKWLDFRLDVAGMQPQEHICTWGQWQRAYYQEQNPPCRDNITTTGHPRFDLYKAPYRAYYAQEAQRWKERYGDFVLVNTNFAWANHMRGEQFVFSPSWHYEPKDSTKRLDHIRQWAHTTNEWSNMVKLVTRLSVEMPHLNIVVRPHPSESMKFYENVFRDVSNVHVEHEGSVGPWLLASRALIHDGCTTALEAHFCGTPILNYKSVVDARYDLQLPNALGRRCHSEEQVLEALQSLLHSRQDTVQNAEQSAGQSAGQSTEPSMGQGVEPSVEPTSQPEQMSEQVPEMARQLIHNFEHDAFEALSHVVHRVAEKAAPASANFEDALRRHQRYERMSTSLRHLKTKLGRNQRAMVDKFYGFEYADLPRKFEKIKQITGRHDVRFTILSSRVFTVEC